MRRFLKVMVATLALLLALIFQTVTGQDEVKKCIRAMNEEEKGTLSGTPGVLACTDDEDVDHICCPLVAMHTWISVGQCCKAKEIAARAADMVGIAVVLLLLLIFGCICTCIGCVTSVKYLWNRRKEASEEEAAAE